MTLISSLQAHPDALRYAFLFLLFVFSGIDAALLGRIAFRERAELKAREALSVYLWGVTFIVTPIAIYCDFTSRYSYALLCVAVLFAVFLLCLFIFRRLDAMRRY